MWYRMDIFWRLGVVALKTYYILRGTSQYRDRMIELWRLPRFPIGSVIAIFDASIWQEPFPI